MQIEIIRSNRKTLALQVTKDARVIARAPLKMPVSVIENFIRQKQDWIMKQVLKMQNEKKAADGRSLTPGQIEALADRAMKVLPGRALYYAQKMGVRFGRLTVRNQKTRWGSCSSKGNLNFNCLLMLCPDRVIDYVVVHELCHLKEMNHSERFWKEVEKVLPDYRERRRWLRENGSILIRQGS